MGDCRKRKIRKRLLLIAKSTGTVPKSHRSVPPHIARTQDETREEIDEPYRSKSSDQKGIEATHQVKNFVEGGERTN